MISRLVDFALLVLQLLMLKVCEIIGISKIESFIFFGTERVEKGLRTQHRLLSLLEASKSSLHQEKVFGALLTDLSKVYDCLLPSFKIMVLTLNHSN